MKTTLMLWLGLNLAGGPWPSSILWAEAFSISSSSTKHLSRRIQTSTSPSLPSSSWSSRLFMSDIPEENKHKQRHNKQRSHRPPSTNNDNDDENDSNNNDSSNNTQDFLSYWITIFLKPPPKPEDQLVMMGDIFSLFIYSITDHLLCQSMSHYALWEASHADPQKLHAIAQSLAAQTTAGSTVLVNTPVWLDTSDVTSINSPVVLQVLHDQVVSQLDVTHYYSPLLESSGMATCVLAATWLCAGYWNRAFLFRNTLHCSTYQALIITGQTWIITAIILLLATMLSSSIMTNSIDYSDTIRIFWTRGDLDFIFGSLSVVALWRFLFSSILGSGGNGGDYDDNNNNHNGKK